MLYPNKKNKFIWKRVLTNALQRAKILSNLNITNNDFDEDGRIVKP